MRARMPIAVFGVILFASVLAMAPPLRAVDSGACVAGSISSPLKIEVFSDYQCPACKAFYLNTMRTIIPEYADSGKACVIYREFPLPMHNHSREAARYGYAAMQIGIKQWELVTDALFMNQDTWAANGDIESIVSKALSKSDMDLMHKQLANPNIEVAVAADVNLGMQRGVNQTPTFFVTANGNTQKIAGGVQYQILKQYLDRLLPQR